MSKFYKWAIARTLLLIAAATISALFGYALGIGMDALSIFFIGAIYESVDGCMRDRQKKHDV